MKLRLKAQLTEFIGTKTFVFETEEPIAWQAGQYIHYTLHHDNPDSRGDERWFTISSAPHEKTIKITTRISPDAGSSFKKALQALIPGQEIEGEEPEGKFVIDDSSQGAVYVAGGIGITPFYSILKQLDHENKDINAELLYANRNQDDIPYHDELEALSEKHKDFNITYFTGDNKIDEESLKAFGDKSKDPIYYISGPEPMVEAFKSTLEHMGINENHSKFDYFPGYEAE
jgi:ferredoxin-NADP reductase